MKNKHSRYSLLFFLILFSITSWAQGDQGVPDLSHFRLTSNKTAVKAGESLTLSAQWFNDLLTSLTQKKDEEYKWTNLPKGLYSTIKWEIASGGGKLMPDAKDPASAVYTATNNAEGTTVFVTATITGLKEQKEAPSTKVASKLTIPITIIKDQYVTYTVDGNTYTVNGDCESGCIYHKPSDRFSLKVTLTNNRWLQVYTDQYKEGTFHFGNEEKEDFVAGIILGTGLGNENKEYHTSYSVSTESCAKCKTEYAAGAVKITKIEEVGQNIKLTKAETTALLNGTASEAVYQKMAQQTSNVKTTYVEGTFEATLYYHDKEDKKSINGKFRVKAW